MPNALAIEIWVVRLRIHAEKEKSMECVVKDTLTNPPVVPMWQMINHELFFQKTLEWWLMISKVR